MKKAFITGITGQDGSFLAEYLLEKGYEVHGLVRRASSFNTERIDHISNKSLILHHGDSTDSCCMRKLVDKIMPDEIYNLSAQSHVATSFEVPLYTAEVDGIGTLVLLDIIKEVNPKIKFYQASTSELFGGLEGTAPQNEKTMFQPRSPYAVAKLYAYWITSNYREAYDLYACNGILFNHESERRTPTFVTRKITYGISQILAGEQEVIKLGNIDAKRDWGYAKDYVECMHLMLQQKTPSDYVIGTGETRTVREFIEEAFKWLCIDIEWQGKGVDERGIDPKTGKVWIEIDPKYFRPTEVDILLSDPTKARNELGWTPKTSFKELVSIMMQHDIGNLIT